MTDPKLSLTETTTQSPIQEGDAALVIRRNGEIVPFTFGINQEELDGLRNKKVEDMTEAQMELVHQGNVFMLLSMAASNDVILTLLAKIAEIPGEVTLEKISKASRGH